MTSLRRKAASLAVAGARPAGLVVRSLPGAAGTGCLAYAAYLQLGTAAAAVVVGVALLALDWRLRP